MKCEVGYIIKLDNTDKKLIEETRDGLATIQDKMCQTHAVKTEFYADITDAILALNELLMGKMIS